MLFLGMGSMATWRERVIGKHGKRRPLGKSDVEKNVHLA
jgi:hypothetical protein